MRTFDSILRLALLTPLVLAACGDDETGNPGSPDAGVDPDAPPEPEPIPLERAQAGGSPTAITLEGDRAYVVVGPRLTIWDVADPTAPVMIGETAPIPGRITDLAVAGSHVYLAEHVDLDGRVHVIDVSTPATPTIVAALRTVPEGEFSNPVGIDATADRLYVADQEQGIVIFDLATPSQPALLDTVASGGVTDVQVVGDRLYYVAGGFLGSSVGVLDPANDHAEIGSVSMSNAIGTAITDGHLVVGIGSGGVEVHDLTDAANPAEIYRSETYLSRAVAASGTTVWMPTDEGLFTLDLSGKTPAVTGPVALATGQANAAAVAGGLLAVITERGQLVTADVTTATAPAGAALVDISLCADCIGVDVVGETLFVADIVGGLRIAALPDLVASGRGKPDEFVVFEDVDVADGLAYVADWNYGLRIFDVSDLAAPVEVGKVQTGGYASTVSVGGGYAYVGESTNGGALKVVDVSDPAKPAVVAQLVTSKSVDVELDGRLVYIADTSLDAPGGMRIVDVGTPTAPALLGSYTTCGEVLDVAVAGDLALLACSYDGFHLVDVSDPANPTQLATWSPPSPNAAQAVALDGARAYLGHSAGVFVADITDPAAPVIGDEYPTAWTVRAIHVPAAGRIVASVGLAGVYQWQLD